MLNDALEGGWIDKQDLTAAIAQVTDFKPTVLVTNEDQFRRYTNALFIHRALWIKSDLKKLGIKRIIWGAYLKNREFELTSEESWQKLQEKNDNDIETISILD